MSSWTKNVVLLNVSLNYISCLDCLWRSLSYRAYRLAGCFQSYMNIACRSTQTAPCIKFIWCLRSKKKTKIILRPRPTSAHSNTQQLALQVWRLHGKIQKWTNGRVTLEIELKYDFRKFLPKNPLLPCILHNGRMNLLNSPIKWGIFHLTRFYLCCCHFYNLLRKESACLDRPEYLMSTL